MIWFYLPPPLQGCSAKPTLLISMADVVEAIASYRPYRPALSIDVAPEEIENNKGVLYGEKVVEACLKLFQEKQFSFEGWVLSERIKAGKIEG